MAGRGGKPGRSLRRQWSTPRSTPHGTSCSALCSHPRWLLIGAPQLFEVGRVGCLELGRIGGGRLALHQKDHELVHGLVDFVEQSVIGPRKGRVTTVVFALVPGALQYLRQG